MCTVYFQAKIMCSSYCKCVGCKNFEESSERKTLMHLADAAEVRVQQQTAAKTKLSSQISGLPIKPPSSLASGERSVISLSLSLYLSLSLSVFVSLSFCLSLSLSLSLFLCLCLYLALSLSLSLFLYHHRSHDFRLNLPHPW